METVRAIAFDSTTHLGNTMELELYVREGCSRCKRVMGALESLGVVASVIDVDGPEAAIKARRMGIRSVPVLYKVDTKQMKVGDVTKEELAKFLE